MYAAISVLFIAASYSEMSDAALFHHFDEHSPIFYPGPIKQAPFDIWRDIFVYQRQRDDPVPEECKNQNFCTIKPKNYPQSKFDSYFRGTTFVPQPSEDMDGNKQGDPNERDDCDSVVTFEPLYKVKSRKDEWRTVVQSPNNNFIQKVRLETCKNPGHTCFKIFPHVPNFTTSCRQKYIIWEILVEGDNGPESVKVDLPVCCSCVYKPSAN